MERLACEYSTESPIKENLAKEISYGLFNSTPLFIGYGIYAPIAYRAKTQLNENSKVIAIAETLPEQNHNGIVIFDNPNVAKKYIPIANPIYPGIFLIPCLWSDFYFF